MATGKHAMSTNKSHDMSTTPNSFNPSNMITHMLKHNKNESLDLIKIYYACIMNERTAICMLSIYINHAIKLRNLQFLR